MKAVNVDGTLVPLLFIMVGLYLPVSRSTPERIFQASRSSSSRHNIYFLAKAVRNKLDEFVEKIRLLHMIVQSTQCRPCRNYTGNRRHVAV